MNLTSMWQTFRARQPRFVQNYIVYHNLRSKGWVPKTGIKFGGDFGTCYNVHVHVFALFFLYITKIYVAMRLSASSCYHH